MKDGKKNAVPFDYGFSTWSTDELTEQLSRGRVEELSMTAEQRIADLTARLNAMFEVVEPLVKRLRDTAASEYIHWPNRGPVMSNMMGELLKLKEGK